MSACLSFWGGEIPDTTPTLPAKEVEIYIDGIVPEGTLLEKSKSQGTARPSPAGQCAIDEPCILKGHLYGVMSEKFLQQHNSVTAYRFVGDVLVPKEERRNPIGVTSFDVPGKGHLNF
jgi:hypothetical protein